MHFSSIPLRCDQVTNSVRWKGPPERKLTDHTCVEVSATDFTKTRISLPAASIVVNLTKSKFQKEREEEERERECSSEQEDKQTGNLKSEWNESFAWILTSAVGSTKAV